MGTIKNTPDDSELRRRAEENLKEATSGSEDLSGVSPERMGSLIHELQVHQIELKMQNDELRRIQGDLERTRDKYSHLYDFAPVGYFTLSEKGIIEEVSLTGAALIGIERSALTGKPFSRFVLKDDQDIFYKHRQRLLETETSQPCELRLVKKDGHEFQARMECMVIKNRGEAFRQIRAAVSDITERDLAEEAMRKSESKYRTLVEGLPQKIFHKDRDSVYLSCSGNFARDLGMKAEEIAGKTDYEFFPKELAEKYRTDDRRIIESEETEDIIEKYIEAGQSIWVHTIKTPVKDEKGVVSGVIGIFWDITKLKKTEEALQESEARYRDLYENAPNAYFSISAADGSILSCNHAATRLLGYGRETLVGMKVLDLYADTPDGKVKARDVFKRFKAGKSIQDLELQMKHKGGHPIWVSLSVEPVKDNGGDIVESRSTVINITERKALESQLVQSQKLEAIGTLAGGIAHDFNNLLTAILGNADMAIVEMGKDSPLYEFLEDIKGAGEMAAGLTRQLLAFSRKQVLQPEVVNLNEMLGNMDRMLRRVIREDIELKTILSPDLGRVEADVGQMEQILMNLAVNAGDAMPKGGRLTLETSNVELNEDYAQNHIAVIPGPYVMLAVSDTGIGMTKKVQDHLFEPFFTTKEKGKGTGLGLSTVYGIVKQSKGNIWVYSEPGKGSTFKIYLPRVKKTVRIMEEAGEKGESLQGSETILVVEDDDMVRSLALKALKKYGYTVLCARDGQDAFHICREHKEPVQLMLTDVVMPGMSGRELAKNLEGLRPEMKVLFMSGYTDNAIVHHGMLDKGIAFIQKPFTPDSLARKVLEVLGD